MREDAFIVAIPAHAVLGCLSYLTQIMPGLWLIARAPPGADLSSLPPNVLDSITDRANILCHYYIEMKETEGRQLASDIEYWKLCWDMHDSNPGDCVE